MAPVTNDGVTANVTCAPQSGASVYDHEGAMKYIVVTILVYSLMGIVSMLLMRIRRRALQASHKTVDHRDQAAENYLKEQASLEVESFRYKLRCEQKKCLAGYIFLDAKVLSTPCRQGNIAASASGRKRREALSIGEGRDLLVSEENDHDASHSDHINLTIESDDESVASGSRNSLGGSESWDSYSSDSNISVHTSNASLNTEIRDELLHAQSKANPDCSSICLEISLSDYDEKDATR